jgi:biotin carboxyl carrier protein
MFFPQGEDRWLVQLGAWSIPIRRVRPGAVKAVKNPKEKRLVALCKGRIHAVLQREGADIAAHERLIVIESLGTLVPHAVPVKVNLKKWHVEVDQVVEQGQELAALLLLS